MSPSPLTARVVLAALAVLTVLGFMTRIPAQPVSSNPEKADAGFHVAVVRRLQRGEPYYQALGVELRSRGYPTASPFNWRTPLLLKAYAAAPTAASVLLLTLGLLSVIATIVLLHKATPEATVLGVILQVGAAASVVIVPASATVPEAWLGYLLLASILAYGRRWNVTAALIGIFALFVRELAAPYCVACGLMALYRRRWREVATWGCGAVAYAGYFAWHVMNVAAHSGPNEVAHHASWIQFGGLPFVLGTLSFNGWFAASQPWGPTIGCVLVLASLWARLASLHLRVCCATYLAFFSVVGQTFNQNWGLVASPAWALACGYGIGGLRRLIRSAREISNA